MSCQPQGQQLKLLQHRALSLLDDIISNAKVFILQKSDLASFQLLFVLFSAASKKGVLINVVFAPVFSSEVYSFS